MTSTPALPSQVPSQSLYIHRLHFSHMPSTHVHGLVDTRRGLSRLFLPPRVLVWVHLREKPPWSPICHFKYQQSLVWRHLAVVRYGNGRTAGTRVMKSGVGGVTGVGGGAAGGGSGCACGCGCCWPLPRPAPLPLPPRDAAGRQRASAAAASAAAASFAKSCSITSRAARSCTSASSACRLSASAQSRSYSSRRRDCTKRLQ